MSNLQCLVIMPFRPDFDPVYEVIRRAVADAVPGRPIECFWLKDVHAAGRISDDILHSIKNSALCVADLTGNNPNVMWETGYAMALGKPTVLVSQDVGELPFDLKMHRVHPYQPAALDDLARVVARAVRETLTRYGIEFRRGLRLAATHRRRAAVLAAVAVLALLLYPVTAWWQHREHRARLGEARAAVGRQNTALNQAEGNGNLDEYGQLFADDGVLLSEGDLVRGREAIRTRAKKYWGKGNPPVVHTVEFDVRDDVAYEIGWFHRGISKGSYLVIWKKQADGEWRIQAEANSASE